MKDDKKYMLINGRFAPIDAKEILLTFINHKINYNKLKNFSSEERHGEPDEHAKQRVEELKYMREKVLQIIEEAIAQKKDLQIESVVKIGLRKKRLANKSAAVTF